jgi:hypothetical protein
MQDLNVSPSNPKLLRRLYLRWLCILLSGVLVAACGGLMFAALYIESSWFVALFAWLVTLNKSWSFKARQEAYNFLVAFTLMAIAFVVVYIWHLRSPFVLHP